IREIRARGGGRRLRGRRGNAAHGGDGLISGGGGGGKSHDLLLFQLLRSSSPFGAKRLEGGDALAGPPPTEGRRRSLFKRSTVRDSIVLVASITVRSAS